MPLEHELQLMLVNTIRKVGLSESSHLHDGIITRNRISRVPLHHGYVWLWIHSLRPLRRKLFRQCRADFMIYCPITRQYVFFAVSWVPLHSSRPFCNLQSSRSTTRHSRLSCSLPSRDRTNGTHVRFVTETDPGSAVDGSECRSSGSL